MSGDASVDAPRRDSGWARILVRYLVREAMGVVMLALLLFVSAGRLDWVMGWVLVCLTLLWASATALVLISQSPGLIAERVGPRKGAKGWDSIIMSIVGLTTIARSVVGGLDQRFGWTTGVPLALQVATTAVALLSYGMSVWATASNPFFSQIVRIQKERGHTVATGGPYRFVRHPAYVGTILFELAAPVILGSWWALIPGGLAATLFLVRTALEDRTLLAELEGYQEYARQVRYRLVPGIW